MILRISAWFLAFFWALPLWAVDCEDRVFEDKSYSICTVSAAQENLRLFLKDDDGAVFGSFNALPDNVVFAMNAGMFHDDRRPVGHYVEDGVEDMRVIASAGPGNFGMLPNGVFCIADGHARVFETSAYLDQNPNCTHATQSGPMLVIDGELHPRFIDGSTYVNIRNGVGSSDDGQTTYFVISNQWVNFHEFARLFKDVLGVNNALYFDGRVSRLYAPQLGRNDFGTRLGPIVGVVE